MFCFSVLMFYVKLLYGYCDIFNNMERHQMQHSNEEKSTTTVQSIVAIHVNGVKMCIISYRFRSARYESWSINSAYSNNLSLTDGSVNSYTSLIARARAYNSYEHYGARKFSSKYSSSNGNCFKIMGFRYGLASFYNLISSNLEFAQAFFLLRIAVSTE